MSSFPPLPPTTFKRYSFTISCSFSEYAQGVLKTHLLVLANLKVELGARLQSVNHLFLELIRAGEEKMEIRRLRNEATESLFVSVAFAQSFSLYHLLVSLHPC